MTDLSLRSARSALGRTRLGDVYRSVRFDLVPQTKARISSRERQKIFTRHFQENHWLADTTRSGPGSTLEETEWLRRDLPLFLSAHGIRTLLDVPCGDWAWMRLVDLDLDRYIGADIVAELVADLQARYRKPNVEFVALDVLRDPLPVVDAILCRDLLIHLPNSSCQRLLTKFRRSGATWLLTTTALGVARNTDVVHGRYRPINLSIEPFSLPPPLMTIREGTGGASQDLGRCLGIWRLDEI
jgi:hypothetical protein